MRQAHIEILPTEIGIVQIETLYKYMANNVLENHLYILNHIIKYNTYNFVDCINNKILPIIIQNKEKLELYNWEIIMISSIKSNIPDMIDILIYHGFDPNWKFIENIGDKMHTGLEWAMHYDKYDCFERLIDLGANTLVYSDDLGYEYDIIYFSVAPFYDKYFNKIISLFTDLDFDYKGKAIFLYIIRRYDVLISKFPNLEVNYYNHESKKLLLVHMAYYEQYTDIDIIYWISQFRTFDPTLKDPSIKYTMIQLYVILLAKSYTHVSIKVRSNDIKSTINNFVQKGANIYDLKNHEFINYLKTIKNEVGKNTYKLLYKIIFNT